MTIGDMIANGIIHGISFLKPHENMTSLRIKIVRADRMSRDVH